MRYMKFRENSTTDVTLRSRQEYVVECITQYHTDRTDERDIYLYQESFVSLFVKDLPSLHPQLVEAAAVVLEHQR